MKIIFMGTPQAAVASLSRLIEDGHEIVAVYTQPDRPSGRGNKITFSPVKAFAADRGLPILQPTKIKTAEAIGEFRSFGADAAVVVAYGRILPATYLAAGPKGAINVHFSLLPKFRGAAPVNWAIASGERETGVTTMRMDEGLDTGPILMQRRVKIGDSETAIELMTRLSAVGAELLSETLHSLDSLKPQIQDSRLASFAPIMRKEDGLIDWHRSAREIADRIRGFQPFPGSFTTFGGARLTIWKAKVVGRPIDVSDPAAGEVIESSSNGFLVGCGGGSALQIEEIQPEGKRRMPIRDFLNGARISAGATLGS